MPATTRPAGIAVAVALLAMTSLSPAAHADGQPADILLLAGPDGQAVTLRREDLARHPISTARVFFSTGHGPVEASFEGVLLCTLLEEAGLTEEATRNAILRRVFTITGRDGYQVVLSGGEIAPMFGGAQVLAARAQDGKPVEGLARLVVPGDKSGGRHVDDIIRIEAAEGAPP
ncbi:molybdopterin-binding protein [Geminicoccus flavidas]|uniref:hypothetical protein n=1 Tax=Geminicoccus flavidas TaxID=2506407 RepID=UPI00135AE1F5|nr:hypothetical protein [Geminicoccus flavidas]